MKKLLLLFAGILACGAFTSVAQSPPDLLIDSITGSQFRLSWTQTPGFLVLEETDTLSLWEPFPQTPTLLDGQFSVMVDMTGDRRFFRLHDVDTGGLPPDPASVASRIPQGVATVLAEATEFLYTGPDPIQTGVGPWHHRSETRRGAAWEGGGSQWGTASRSANHYPRGKKGSGE